MPCSRSSHPQPVIWEVIHQAYNNHPDTLKLLIDVAKDFGSHPNLTLCDSLLLFHGMVWIPPNSALQPLLLVEFHNTPTGGHARV